MLILPTKFEIINRLENDLYIYDYIYNENIIKLVDKYRIKSTVWGVEKPKIEIQNEGKS